MHQRHDPPQTKVQNPEENISRFASIKTTASAQFRKGQDRKAHRIGTGEKQTQTFFKEIIKWLVLQVLIYPETSALRSA